MRTRIPLAACALLGALGALGATATAARADTRDSEFITVLQNEGISDHLSPAHAIEAGHTVCQKLEQGMTPTDVASDVLNSSSMPAYEAGYFVGVAIEVYCPQFEPEEARR